MLLYRQDHQTPLWMGAKNAPHLKIEERPSSYHPAALPSNGFKYRAICYATELKLHRMLWHDQLLTSTITTPVYFITCL
jgi:hypothetical protein